MSGPEGDNVLLKRAARAMFWNASILPLVSAVNLLAAVLIRRRFGLESGVYDVALGVINTLLVHSGLGVPATIGQFVPALERAGGRQEVGRFLRRVASLRVALLLAVLAPAQLFLTEIGAYLHLGAHGVWILRLVSLLAILRAGADLSIKGLQALLAHFLANMVQLAQAVALLGAAAWATAGGSVEDLLARLTVLSAAVLLLSIWMVRREVQAVPAPAVAPAAAGPSTVAAGFSSPQQPPAGPSGPVFWRFAVFMYAFEVSHYFTTPAFASPALAAASGGTATVALFNVAFQFPMTVVVVMLAGFQGLYRPLFATVLAEGSPDRTRAVFSEISKLQAVLLIPAGAGLIVMLPAYIPLLFGARFADAVTLSQILCVFLFLEALFNLGSILLSVDHRYGPVLVTQGLRVVVAPLFVWLAVRGHLLLAVTAFGAGRILAVGFGFVVARRLYGLRFPAAFTWRVCVPAALMAAVVAAGRALLPVSFATAGLLTAAGFVVAVAGTRWARVLSPRELDLLERTALPGRKVLLRWLVG